MDRSEPLEQDEIFCTILCGDRTSTAIRPCFTAPLSCQKHVPRGVLVLRRTLTPSSPDLLSATRAPCCHMRRGSLPFSGRPRAWMNGGEFTNHEQKRAPTAMATVEAEAPRARRMPVARALSVGEELCDGRTVCVGGWVKTGRVQGKGTFAFVELNDGSCASNLQVIVESELRPLADVTPTGTCLVIEGQMKRTPEGTKQPVELRATRIRHVGPCDPQTYPIAKTRMGPEFLRTVMHLRPRTNLISAVTRIRSNLAAATHRYFHDNGFVYVHTPIITTSDCEGAGEMFQVTTLLSQAENAAPKPSDEQLQAMRKDVEEQGNCVRTAKKEKNPNIAQEIEKLESLKERLKISETALTCEGGIPRRPDGSIDYTQDFFGKPSFLTVSGQLQAEMYACALTNVYTFGPTFRAENSNTIRHLAEFWMIEPELAFADLVDDMNCAEEYVKYCCKWLLEHCMEDMRFFERFVDKTCVDRLKLVANTPFGRVSYTECIEILLENIEQGKVTFKNPVEWGIDLATEHEKYLADTVFKKPIIVYNYPKDIKAFYMRLNDDERTVAAMDLLVPKVGELIGGSQREERLDVLERRLKECGLPEDPYQWYLDLRRYGTVPHAGFGLGFERLVLFTTGLENIRESIPLPRWPDHADF